MHIVLSVRERIRLDSGLSRLLMYPRVHRGSLKAGGAVKALSFFACAYALRKEIGVQGGRRSSFGPSAATVRNRANGG
jgi:hypothetical protein